MLLIFAWAPGRCRYSTWSAAKNACIDLGDACFGVYDGGCNEQDDNKLCKGPGESGDTIATASDLSTSSTSCVFEMPAGAQVGGGGGGCARIATASVSSNGAVAACKALCVAEPDCGGISISTSGTDRTCELVSHACVSDPNSDGIVQDTSSYESHAMYATQCLDKNTVCTDLESSGRQQALIVETEGTYTRDTDNTLCVVKTACAQGQKHSLNHAGTTTRAQYDAGGYDGCIPCPQNEYRHADKPQWTTDWYDASTFGNNEISYHHYSECLPCPGGTFTLSQGTVDAALCRPPSVVTYRSTHRLYYWFNDALKASTQCLRTAIATEDASSTIGNSALRINAFSPMCAKLAGSYAETYSQEKKQDEFSWNNFPLNIMTGEILVVDVLPGQSVSAVFTALDADGLALQHTVTGADGEDTQEDKPPLVQTSASICGCIDYKDILPVSQCEDAMVLKVLSTDVPDLVNGVAVESFVVELANTFVHLGGDGNWGRTSGDVVTANALFLGKGARLENDPEPTQATHHVSEVGPTVAPGLLACQASTPLDSPLPLQFHALCRGGLGWGSTVC